MTDKLSDTYNFVSKERLAEIKDEVDAILPRDINSFTQKLKDRVAKHFDSSDTRDEKWSQYFSKLDTPDENFEAYRHIWKIGIASEYVLEQVLENALRASRLMSSDNEKIALRWLDDNAPEHSSVTHLIEMRLEKIKHTEKMATIETPPLKGLPAQGKAINNVELPNVSKAETRAEEIRSDIDSLLPRNDSSFTEKEEQQRISQYINGLSTDKEQSTACKYLLSIKALPPQFKAAAESLLKELEQAGNTADADHDVQPSI